MRGAHDGVAPGSREARQTLSLAHKEVAAALPAGVSPYSKEGRQACAFGAWLLDAQRVWMAENGRKFPRRDEHDGARRDYRPRNSFDGGRR